MQMEVLKSSSDKEMVRWCVHQLTVRALIAGVAGRNTYAMRVLVKAHQFYIHLFNDESARYWTLTHLMSIVARVEDWNRDATTSLGLDFDRLFHMLRGFMSVKDDEVFDDEVKSLLKDNYSRIWPQTAEWIDEILAPQSEAWAAFYIGQAAIQNRRGLSRLKTCLQLTAPLEKASDLKKQVSWSLLQYLTVQTRLLFSLDDDREAMVCWFSGGNYDADISNLILMLLQKNHRSKMKEDVIHFTDDYSVVNIYKVGRTLCDMQMFQKAKVVNGMLNRVAEMKTSILSQGLAEKLNGYMAVILGQYPESLIHNYRAISLLSQLPTDRKKNELDFLLGVSAASAAPDTVESTSIAIANAWQQIAKVETDPRKAAYARNMSVKIIAKTSRNPILLLQRKREDAEAHLKNGRLAEAEACAAEVLVLTEQTGIFYFKARALLLLADITYAFHVSTASAKYPYHVIQSFLVEAEQVGNAHPELLHIILHDQAINYIQNDNLELAIETLERMGTSLLQLDFGSFNVGRLCYLEKTKHSLRLLQEVLIKQHQRVSEDKPVTEMHEALIWAERGRSRDLLYNIRMPEQRKAYLEELAEFDRIHKVGAWQEIEKIVHLSDPRTAFLVLTAVNNKICGYILSYDPNDPEREVNWTCFMTSYTSNRSISELVKETLMNIKSNYNWENYLQLWYHLLIFRCKHFLDALQIQQLVIVPQEDMFILPFAAFHEGDGKPFLIEQYAISVVPSLRTYKQCQLQLKKLQQQPNDAGLVIGNPAAGGDFLQAAEEETSFVRAKLEESGFTVTHLQRDEATKEAAMELLPKSSWFHIACHAVSNPEFPSGALMLARKAISSQTADASELDGSERTVVARFERHLEELVRSTGRAEMLTGEDLENAGKPLQAKVAVLSACSTGLGRIFSDGVIGLSRSLHMLGVSSVVASLWNVADDSTNVLMERFYNHLHVDGMNVAKALQRAMVSMIKEEDEDTEESKYSPYHWAPFIISGTDTVTLKVSYTC